MRSPRLAISSVMFGLVTFSMSAGSSIADDRPPKTSTGSSPRPAAKEITLTGHSENVLAAQILPDNQTLLSVSGMNARKGTSLRYWNLENGKEIRRFGFPTSPYAAALSPDAKKVAIRFEDSLALIDTTSGEFDYRMEIPKSAGGPLLFSPDGSRILAFHGRHVCV